MVPIRTLPLPAALLCPCPSPPLPPFQGSNKDEGELFVWMVPSITHDKLPFSEKGAKRVQKEGGNLYMRIVCSINVPLGACSSIYARSPAPVSYRLDQRLPTR